jgi:hypothetical protein
LSFCLAIHKLTASKPGMLGSACRMLRKHATAFRDGKQESGEIHN